MGALQGTDRFAVVQLNDRTGGVLDRAVGVVFAFPSVEDAREYLPELEESPSDHAHEALMLSADEYEETD